MIFFANFMQFFWVLLTIYWFSKKDPREAVLLSYIGGMLFLSNIEIDIPVISYNKISAIAIGVLLGGYLLKKNITYKKIFFDHVMITLCFVSAILTSLVNGYGLYEGFAVALGNFLGWGVPFITGRKYFRSEKDLKLLVKYILAGVLMYVPLCQYELKMSPQLHMRLYGFFQHSWNQHIRYGGYRPIVFMQHGLMVSLWLMVGTVIFFWLWRAKKEKKMFNIPLSILFAVSFLTLFMSKSKGALFLGILGIFFWYAYKINKIEKLFIITIMIFPVYFFIRIFGLMTVGDLAEIMSRIFDQERIDSLVFRLNSEDIIVNSMGFFQFLFGWHRWARALGVNPFTGRAVVVDSLWIIIFGSRGLLGLSGIFLLFFSGPITIVKNLKRKRTVCFESLVLSLVVLLFAIDCLSNSFVNPIYLLCTGALVSYGENNFIEKKSMDNSDNRFHQMGI